MVENKHNSPIPFTPSICITQSDITKVPLSELIEYKGELYNKIRKDLKGICFYRWDNGILRWSNISGSEFKIMVNNPFPGNVWSIGVWDMHSRSVLSIEQPLVSIETDVLSEENYNLLCRVTNAYGQGKIRCSHCGKEINKNEIAGHFFAGSYCKHCWETTGVKQQAEKETYE